MVKRITLLRRSFCAFCWLQVGRSLEGGAEKELGVSFAPTAVRTRTKASIGLANKKIRSHSYAADDPRAMQAPLVTPIASRMTPAATFPAVGCLNW